MPVVLYLDTSALVKLYAEEEHTAEVEQAVEAAGVLASSKLVYAEARAAFARIERDGRFTAAEHDRAVADLQADLQAYALGDVEDAVVYAAGGLARRHGLRGYDAVHLAMALTFSEAADEDRRAEDDEAGTDAPFAFLAYDGDLSAAALREGMPRPSEGTNETR